MAIACDKCGIESEIPEAFVKRRKSFRRSFRTECPRCHNEWQLAGLRRNLLWTLTFGVIGLVLVWTLPQRAGGWLLLNLFLFELSLIASILPHELFHAVAGRWLGFRVFKIYVGYGKTLFTTKLFGFPTEFKALPFAGLVLATPTDTNRFRLKQIVFIFAGPLANIVLCAGVLCFVPLQDLWDIGRIGHGLAPAQVFLYANLVTLVCNLWPHSFNSPIGSLASDGKLLWQTLFQKCEAADLLVARYALEAINCYEGRRIRDALAWTNEGLAHDSENIWLLNLRGVLLLESGDFEAACDCFEKLLGRADNSPVVRGLLLNNLAYANALLGGNERLVEADRFSQEAMSLIGWEPSVKGTRGTTLLELGQIDAALVLLRESMGQTERADSKAQNACFIAMGEARRGNLAESGKYLNEARRLRPDCFLLSRATREFDTCSRL